MWHVFSTFTSEITNKNCPVTFLLTPSPPKVSRIIWMAPKEVWQDHRCTQIGESGMKQQTPRQIFKNLWLKMQQKFYKTQKEGTPWFFQNHETPPH